MLTQEQKTGCMLEFKLILIRDLREHDIERMYALMAENYDDMKQDIFLKDLEWKTCVGVLYDSNGQIGGFTTFGINPNRCGTHQYNVLFSGDTIISPAYWGSQKLVKGVAHTMGMFLGASQGKKLYWYLLSKGHRTYMYLPLFYKKYYPACEMRYQADLYDVVDRCSSLMYAECWKPKTGIVRFEESHGKLKAPLAEGAWKKRCNRHVKYFLEKNPHFDQGDELVCLAEIHPENIKRFARSYIIAGMKDKNDTVLSIQ